MIRALLAALAVLLAAACTPVVLPAGPPVAAPRLEAAAVVAADGARLPMRVFPPEGAPRAVILALHGFNDSRDAWELPAPALAALGIALYAPDQRGFGATEARGLWPGAGARE